MGIIAAIFIKKDSRPSKSTCVECIFSSSSLLPAPTTEEKSNYDSSQDRSGKGTANTTNYCDRAHPTAGLG